jgi:aerobic-type carbon monoxide dehydrogenase small subunit (CoxS/CutS family)
MLAVEADGKGILTVEGLSADGNLHPIQRAFLEHGGLQCGFCTPGMIMSALALLNENANPSVGDIEEALQGNLCRCTGYVKIIDAIKAVANSNPGN